MSLTVTEGGYNIDDTSGQFDLTTPAIHADLQADAVPQTVFGFIVEALRRRREAGTAPFTVMSCDNLQGNGDIDHRAVVAFAAAKDRALGEWISEHVPFPNSMVDRITPATTNADRDLARALGRPDAWPVVSEQFSQWILEDTFATGRPPLELVGVQLVEDVRPYEKLKLRLLNGGHPAPA